MNLQQELKEVLEYRDGKFYWLIDGNNQFVKKGKRAGTLDKSDNTSGGYRKIRVLGKRYKEHHLVWLYFKGELPKQLDHINRIRDDNRIENLREATGFENARNRTPNKRSTSIYKGVTLNKRMGRFQARIRVNNKLIHLGTFRDEKQAAQAYNEAAIKYFGEYAHINELNL